MATCGAHRADCETGYLPDTPRAAGNVATAHQYENAAKRINASPETTWSVFADASVIACYEVGTTAHLTIETIAEAFGGIVKAGAYRAPVTAHQIAEDVAASSANDRRFMLGESV